MFSPSVHRRPMATHSEDYAAARLASMRGRPNRVATRPAGRAGMPRRPDGMSDRPEGPALRWPRRPVRRAPRRAADRRRLLRLRPHRSVGSRSAALAARSRDIVHARLRSASSSTTSWPRARPGDTSSVRRRSGCAKATCSVPAGRRARAVERARHARGARSRDVRAVVDAAAARLRAWRRRRRIARASSADSSASTSGPYNPLLTALPPVIHLPAAGPDAAIAPARHALLDHRRPRNRDAAVPAPRTCCRGCRS